MEEAKAILSNTRDSFINSLISKFPHFSQGQLFWFFKKAEEFNNKGKGNNSGGHDLGMPLTRINELFITAKNNKLKHPKIRLKTESGRNIVLSLAPETGKNPGCIYVKVEGEYAGKITPQGVFHLANNGDNNLIIYLESLARDTELTARAYGRRTGNCCFCGLELTDGRSVNVGYGPICAEKYGLAWG